MVGDIKIIAKLDKIKNRRKLVHFSLRGALPRTPPGLAPWTPIFTLVHQIEPLIRSTTRHSTDTNYRSNRLGTDTTGHTLHSQRPLTNSLGVSASVGPAVCKAFQPGS